MEICHRIGACKSLYFTFPQVLNMEAYILQQLQFRLRAITPKTYMSRFLRAAGATKGDILTNLVKYLTELTLPEYRFLKYRPSEIAAAAVLCARMILNINSPWVSLDNFLLKTSKCLRSKGVLNLFRLKIWNITPDINKRT